MLNDRQGTRDELTAEIARNFLGDLGELRGLTYADSVNENNNNSTHKYQLYSYIQLQLTSSCTC